MYARDCDQIAVVPVNDSPTRDLCSSLTTVDVFSLAVYAKTRFTAILARTIERRATGAANLGRFGTTFRRERRLTRTAVAQGRIRMADGRFDPAFFGGHSRLISDVRKWERGDEPRDLPIQLKRLRELEAAGVDVVAFPTDQPVDARFAGIKLAQPIVICQERFRVAETSGRVRVRWS
jgi:hypothetical protein